MSDEAIQKPIPEADEESAPFFDGAMQGKLMLMRCNACDAWRLPSRTHCDRCLSAEYRWEEASGRGVVRSFGVMHQLYHKGFEQEIPYTLATVELNEGPRLPTNLVELNGKQAEVGMPVEVTWEKHEDVALPKFRPAG